MQININTTTRKLAVVGLFKNRQQAETAVEQLKASMFAGQDISVLFPHKAETKEFARTEETKASEDALKGIGAGGILGGLAGWLAGIGALAIPGLGPFIAAGPIMGLLGGAAIGGTIGGVVGALLGMGVPEETAKHYESRLKEGQILIAVHSDNVEERVRAREILQACGATDITTTDAPTTVVSTKRESTLRAAGERVSDTLHRAKEGVKDTYRDIKERKIS